MAIKMVTYPKRESTNKFIIIFVALLIIFAFCLGTYILVTSYLNYFEDVILARKTEIGETWIELDFKEVDTQKKDKYFLALVVESPFDGGFDKKGIKTPKGEIVNPEIKLVDEKGDTYEFELCRGGSYGFNGKLVGYCLRPDIPKNKQLKKVLIRCNKQIVVKSIIWRGYDIKDLK